MKDGEKGRGKEGKREGGGGEGGGGGGVVEVGTLCMKQTKRREGGRGEKDGWTGMGREGRKGWRWGGMKCVDMAHSLTLDCMYGNCG